MITQIPYIDNDFNGLSDGNVPPNNNYTEQAIRPFTIRCKNYNFMETDHGARASAMIYNIVETAKANALNNYKSLELLLTELSLNLLSFYLGTL